MISICSRYLLLVAALFVTALSPPAQAQDRAEYDESEERELEEVIVTARFREESMQSIGAGIAAYDEKMIAQEGLIEVQDIALRTIGMEVLDLGPNINDINIRGISNALPTGRGLKALTSTFVDDVAVSGLGSGAATDFNTFDFARIEVLRGPQPTYFGEGSVGGTVRYFSKDPDLSQGFEGTARGGFSSTRHGDTSWRVDAAMTAPVIEDELAFRLVGYHQDQGGFIDLPKLDIKDANNFVSDGFRGIMLWQPSEKFSLRLSAHVNRLEYGEINEIDPTQEDLDGSLSGDNLYSAASIEADNYDDYDLYTLKLGYDFESIRMESITGYFSRNLNTSAENSANTVGFRLFLANAFGVTDIDTTVLSLSDKAETTFSQEFRFISDFDGDLNFTGGLYFKDSDLKEVTELNSEGLAAILIPSKPDLYYSDTTDTTKQISIFTELTWSVSERLRLIGGVRYVHEDFTTTINEQALIQLAQFQGINPDTGYPQFPIGSDLDTLASFGLGNSFVFELREWLPRLAVEYDLNDNMLLYANAARGMRNGGLNSIVSSAVLAVDPETGELDEDIFLNALRYSEDTVDTIEFGLKTVLHDGRATLNTAIYFSDYQDPQVLVGIPFFGVENAPDEDIWGIEVESTYMLGDNWTAFANAAYLDAEFTESMRLTNIPGAPEDYEDLQKGNRPVNTPEWTLAVGADFDYPLSGGLSVFGHGSFAYVDERYGAVQNFPSTQLGSIEVLNLRIGLRSRQWSVIVYGDNLLNDIEKQATVAPSNAAFIDEDGVLDANLSQLFVNRPATVGLIVQYDF